MNEHKLELYHKLARHFWAIIMLIAELHLGVKPSWKK